MHVKNITNVSAGISGADEALKWNNDSRSQLSVSCRAAISSTPPKLKLVTQVLKRKVEECGNSVSGYREVCFERGALQTQSSFWIRLIHKATGTNCGPSACIKNFQWNPRWQRTPVTQKVTFSFLSQSWVETAAWCWRTLLLDKMQWAQKHWQSHAAVLGDCSAILITFQPEIYICTPKYLLQLSCNDICHNVLSKNLYRDSKSLLYFSL